MENNLKLFIFLYLCIIIVHNTFPQINIYLFTFIGIIGIYLLNNLNKNKEYFIQSNSSFKTFLLNFGGFNGVGAFTMYDGRNYDYYVNTSRISLMLPLKVYVRTPVILTKYKQLRTGWTKILNRFIELKIPFCGGNCVTIQNCTILSPYPNSTNYDFQTRSSLINKYLNHETNPVYNPQIIRINIGDANDEKIQNILNKMGLFLTSFINYILNPNNASIIINEYNTDTIPGLRQGICIRLQFIENMFVSP